MNENPARLQPYRRLLADGGTTELIEYCKERNVPHYIEGDYLYLHLPRLTTLSLEFGGLFGGLFNYKKLEDEAFPPTSETPTQ